MKLDLLLRVATKFILPFMFVFALYVQFHGDFGPGGGFQAGVIAAAMIIFYAIIFGLEAAKGVAPEWVVEKMMPLGVLIYASTGAISFFYGKNFLDYSVFDLHDPAHGQHIGILLIEFGVLVTVCGTMIAIFYAFVGRGSS
ncbi:MAG: Na(+)/H(+) antiporter subunit B [Pseudomonadota bacterium]